VPRTNSAFWEKKIKYNRTKDRRITKLLRSRGWKVVRIWESTLRRWPDACLARVIRALKKSCS
jgi:DNA mismatch endonuclease (patch repair protein)